MTTKARKRVVIYGSIVWAILFPLSFYLMFTHPAGWSGRIMLAVVAVIALFVSNQQRTLKNERELGKMEPWYNKGQEE